MEHPVDLRKLLEGVLLPTEVAKISSLQWKNRHISSAERRQAWIELRLPSHIALLYPWLDCMTNNSELHSGGVNYLT
jgi:hypothetical protein